MTEAAARDGADGGRERWQAANLAALGAEVAAVRDRLLGRDAEPPQTEVTTALDLVGTTFGLSDFERCLVVLCAGGDLDARFAEAVGVAHGNPLADQPTFALATRFLPAPHWSALSPAAPLRHWRLVEPATSASSLTTAPLRLDEWLLHVLVGAAALDRRLAGIVAPIDATPEATATTDRAAGALTRAWQQNSLAPVTLRGRSVESRRAAFVAACRTVGWRACAVSADDLPARPDERAELRRLWERDASFDPGALLVEVDPASDPATRRCAQRFVDGLAVPAVLAVDDNERTGHRATLVIETARPTPGEQRALWRAALAPAPALGSLNGALDRVVAQFDLDADTITAAAARAVASELGEPGARVWEACRATARGGLDDLAQRIDSRASFDDLVVPAPQRALLADIVAHVQHRGRVYDDWGMAAMSNVGLGITALFSGPSGTGKTLAASVVANELALDLYRIDLSQVVSKYIGETEKNLRQIFTAAADSGAVLLFDEADALFGKRSEVRDSHDRYANMEISYLLQAMDSYRGLAILTTNLRTALDPALLRRLRFAVTFPFPGPAERAAIWQRVFPAATPTRGLRVDRLARLAVAGGEIRNIALLAAFHAADAGTPVGMDDVLHAAATEYAKLERPLTDAEIGGWT